MAAREIPENHRQFIDFLQKDLPESGRVNLSGKSELESTHAILKLIPIEKRETIVNGFFADYHKSQSIGERVIEHAPELIEKTALDGKPQAVKVEHGEINQPEVLSDAYRSVEDINRSNGIGINPKTELEARAYIFAKTDDRTRDKISSSIAAEASEKAAELKVTQVQELKRNREMTQENPYTEGQTQTRGRSR